MTQQEYEQKKHECFAQFCKDNGIDQEVNISIFDAFDQIFDRAYALGKKFGISDFSDAEGEEMLTVSRNNVMAYYRDAQEDEEEFHPAVENACNIMYQRAVGRRQMLKRLFGSKCLPDVPSSAPSIKPDVPNSEPRDCDNPLADKDDCRWRNDGKCAFNNACYFEPLNSQESKPVEPKFKVGDMAVVRGFKHPLLKSDGAIVTILSYHEKDDFYSCAIAPNIGIVVAAKYLEPYTEPTNFW